MKFIQSEKNPLPSFTSKKIIFIICAILCALPVVSSPVALIIGFIVAQIIGNPYEIQSRKFSGILLKFAVVGLGFGMNIFSAIKAGKEGIIFTIISIVCLMFLGYLLTKFFKIEKVTGYLISAGTAICGGSAIAAIAPVIKSDEKHTSVALGVIFILNSIALFLFPSIGHWLDLSQQEFGLWCAIAIHDTSSVVGAANKYGPEALQIATTVKLARALWIIPIALLTSVLFKNKSNKVKIPYFIGLFILAMLMNTYIPQTALLAPYLVNIAKIGLTLTLFLIGAGLNFNVLKSVGLKPLFQGVLLWIFIGTAALLSIMYFS